MEKQFSLEQIAEMGLNDNIPKHIGIIMDGNGRWATKRGMIRSMGHRAGVERLRGIIKMSSKLGVKALSLYVFSTENWKRPKEEVGVLFNLIVEYFKKEIRELSDNGVVISVLGDMDSLPDLVRETLEEAIKITSQNTGLKLNLSINYGGRAEIANAFKQMANEIENNKLNINDVDEKTISQYLYTKGLPDVDLVIRTGGEQRLSNFLLYQVAYAEFIFTDTYWPDFSDEEYVEAIKEFQRRNRRYGGLK